MRTLTQQETQTVAGAALSGDQLTYVITLSAQAAVNLALHASLNALGFIVPGVPPSMLISYVVTPALNISTLAFVTDICNGYFRNPATNPA